MDESGATRQGKAGLIPYDMAHWYRGGDIHAGCQAFIDRQPPHARSHDRAWQVPLFIATGSKDTLVPPGRNGEKLAAVLAAQGKTVTYEKCAGADHDFSGALQTFAADLHAFFE